MHEFFRYYPGSALQLTSAGTVLESNGALDAVVGRELAGMPLADVLDDSSLRKWHTLTTGQPASSATCELGFHTADSIVERRFTIVRSEHGDCLWLIEQLRDVKQQQLYEELSSLNSELTAMQRQVARDRSKLARALDVAEQAVRTRDEVLAIVSHDLRNPMNTIRMAAGLLELDIPQERKSQQVQAIIRSVERMNRLIEDLLDVSAIEAGKFKIDASAVNVRALLTELHTLQETQATQKHLQLTWRVADDVDVINGDHHRLLQALVNVVGNAVKFTPPGGRVQIAVTRADGAAQFSVADTGPGISAEDAPRIFDRFWHATRTHHTGSGLGLAITKGIVDAHGGRIWVNTTRANGTEICWTIPLLSEGKTTPRRVDTPPAEG